MTNTTLCFVDTETTGLNVSIHDMWEVAVIRRDPSGRELRVVYQVLPDLEKASKQAMLVNHFAQNFKVPQGHEAARIDEDGKIQPLRFNMVQRRLSRLLLDSVMIGNNPSFDARFLRRFLQGAEPWHYRPVDVITMAATRLGLIGPDDLPWRSEDISRKLGVEPPSGPERHTSMGDAIWARDIFDALQKIPA